MLLIYFCAISILGKLFQKFSQKCSSDHDIMSKLILKEKVNIKQYYFTLSYFLY